MLLCCIAWLLKSDVEKHILDTVQSLHLHTHNYSISGCILKNWMDGPKNLSASFSNQHFCEGIWLGYGFIVWGCSRWGDWCLTRHNPPIPPLLQAAWITRSLPSDLTSELWPWPESLRQVPEVPKDTTKEPRIKPKVDGSQMLNCIYTHRSWITGVSVTCHLNSFDP